MEYNFWFIVLWFFLSLILSLLLLFASYLIMSKQASVDKFSPYGKCGFEPFEDTRSTFDVRFYLVSILFIIFDLEILFLFPLVYCFKIFGVFWVCVLCYFFLFVLTVGFYYEWF